MNAVLPFNPQSTGPALPLPGKKRWQPLRAGVVEIFFYDVEEFWFFDGHIVYRGVRQRGSGQEKPVVGNVFVRHGHPELARKWRRIGSAGRTAS